VALFASVLRKDADGRTYLVTPAEKVDVKVADAPFLGVELRCEGTGVGQTLQVRTNLDEWVAIDAAHPIRFVAETTGGLRPYVIVRGRLEARLLRKPYLDLMEVADFDLNQPDLNPPGVWSGGVWWPIVAAGAELP